MNISSGFVARSFIDNSLRTTNASQIPMDVSAPAPIPEYQLKSLAHVVQSNPGMIRKGTQAQMDAWARTQLLFQDSRPVGAPDNAPENIYAEVKVNGNVVATLYNSGGSAMTGDAAAYVGGPNEPNLIGPDLAKWRANTIADALGGTVEMASTAKSQVEWQPRVVAPPRIYSRAELDHAIEAIQQAGERAVVTRASRMRTDLLL